MIPSRLEADPTGKRPARAAIRRTLSEIVGFVLDTTRMQRWLVKDLVVVVAFHRVNPDTAGDAISVSPEEFQAYCRFFRRHFDVVPLRTLLDRREAGEEAGGSLAITFDDGYRDNIRFAAPILKSLQLPATFFVATGYVGTARVAPWDEHITPPPPWMSWNEVRGLREMGFDVGAHTVNHIDLAAAEGSEARRELSESRRMLEEALGEGVDLFSYPFGGPEHITDDVREMVRAEGFRCCPSCHGGLNDSRTDPFRMSRVPINAWFSSTRHFAFNLMLRRV